MFLTYCCTPSKFKVRMFSKHKGKGKGVGKGQSNRHKDRRYHTNTEIIAATSTVLTDTIQLNPKESLENTKNKRCQDKQQQSFMRYQASSPSTKLSREDPLMADLLWRNVQPEEECIPR